MYYMNGRRKAVRKRLPSKKELRKMAKKNEETRLKENKERVLKNLQDIKEDVKEIVKDAAVEIKEKIVEKVEEVKEDIKEEVLEDMDKDALIELAKSLGINAMKNWKTSTIISKIEDARK